MIANQIKRCDLLFLAGVRKKIAFLADRQNEGIFLSVQSSDILWLALRELHPIV